MSLNSKLRGRITQDNAKILWLSVGELKNMSEIFPKRINLKGV